MKTFEVLTVDTDWVWEIHAENCTDVKKKRQLRLAVSTKVEAENANEALEQWMDEELIEMGYTTEDARIMNCARG